MPLTEQDYLKDVLPFWDKLTEEQRQDILTHATPRRFAPGESLHSGSADCLGIYVVKSGQVRVFTLSQAGREITLFRLFERDICLLSASCVMKNIHFEVHVEAERPTEILLIPTPVYDRLNRNSLAVADYTSQLMSSRFSEVMWLMEQVLFSSFDKRLAHFLLEQSAIDGTDSLTITHETIARNLGSAREVVTRMLKYFQDEGMVALSRGGLQITDRDRLEKLDEE
ncbi:Crp/Fnr family transcriptional regulator [Acetanaerobacterium elongatum]|uniref:CRP/FNR family transcriptional regulator, anaerobic regulatory protein n=1 Tax=Acetanaerobacterium elongatum TaxID=258515 RepID=A0A1G9V2F6_9FIRM|nr:Crp/Fnr family transcriptional regulator [Acetanaerobacterium elongatum]SDM66461.1 CRP/FNR family transcriptional regulator, anaerobic regulatory protein [Acetanaerobacterium elongatum]